MFARTERLLLRPVWREDAPALHAAINDEQLIAKLARVPWPYTPSDAEAFCAAERDPLRPAMLIFARTHGSPRLVGGIGLHDEEGEPALGYWIRRDHWGLGFATEAGRAVVDMALNGLRLPRLVAHHRADNPASGRVLRKLGFRACRPFMAEARGAEVPAIRYALEAGGTERLAA